MFQRVELLALVLRSMESNLTGWSYQKSLSGQVWWVVMTQAYNFFSKWFIFALSKPCSLFLIILANTLLKWDNYLQV